MSTQRDVQRGAFVNGLGILGKVAGPLFLLLVTRLYGAETFGIFVTASSLVEMAVAFLTTGFKDAALIYIARHADDEDERPALYAAFANALAFSLVCAVGLLLLAFVGGPVLLHRIYPQFSEALVPAVGLMALVLPAMAFSRVVLAATQGLKIMKYDAFVGGYGGPIALLLAALAFWTWQPNVFGLAAAYAVAQTVVFAGSLWIYAREFEWRPLGTAFRTFRLNREMIAFALPQNLNMTFNRFITNLDVLMLGALGVSAAGVGVYGVGSQIVREIRQVKFAFSNAFAPHIVRLYRRGALDELGAAYADTSRWIASLAVPLTLAVAALHPDLLRIFYPDYSGPPPTFMLWLLPIPYLISGFGTAGNIVVMTGRSHLNLLNSVTVGVLNVGLNLLLIPHYGLAGAAAASSLATLGLVTMEMIEVRQVLGVPLHADRFFRPHVAGGVGVLALVLAASSVGFYDATLGVRIGLAAGALVVYALVLVVLSGRLPQPPPFLRKKHAR
jgi:O-antigen/teichoic acid export membrane protein